MGFPPKYHHLYYRFYEDPELMTKDFDVVKDCSINVNSTVYNSVYNNAIYWINLSCGLITNVAARWKHFHLIPKCTIGVLHSTLTHMKNNSAIVRFDDGRKIYKPEQSLPLNDQLLKDYGYAW